MKQVYESVNTRFNFDTRGGRGVESGGGRKKNADFSGDVWPRFRETVDHVSTSGEFPHR